MEHLSSAVSRDECRAEIFSTPACTSGAIVIGSGSLSCEDLDAGIEADLVCDDGIHDGHQVDKTMELGQVVCLEERFVMSDTVPEYPDPFDFTVESPPISGTLEPRGKVRAPKRLHIINRDTVTTPARTKKPDPVPERQLGHDSSRSQLVVQLDSADRLADVFLRPAIEPHMIPPGVTSDTVSEGVVDSVTDRYLGEPV
jgi:hypothetical protein